MEVLSGVPQGSVLGPLLFIIYINDIVNTLGCHCYLYADDMKLYKIIQSNDDCISLQSDMDRVVEWSSDWKIKLNIAKCKVIRLNGNENMGMPVYSIGENSLAQALKKTDSEKDLGITIDSQLNFDNHIAETINKANRIVGLIKRNFKDLNYSSFCAIYKALVRSFGIRTVCMESL